MDSKISPRWYFELFLSQQTIELFESLKRNFKLFLFGKSIAEVFITVLCCQLAYFRKLRLNFYQLIYTRMCLSELSYINLDLFRHILWVRTIALNRIFSTSDWYSATNILFLIFFQAKSMDPLKRFPFWSLGVNAASFQSVSRTFISISTRNLRNLALIWNVVGSHIHWIVFLLEVWMFRAVSFLTRLCFKFVFNCLKCNKSQVHG
jgi:hypothetical protein